MTIAIVLGLASMTFANPDGGGIFQRGATPEKEGVYGNRDGGLMTPGLPNHGQGDNQNAPLGSGIVVLAGLGAAYLVAKKRSEE